VTTNESPLAGLDFALVGPGRVGTSLALWAVARGARCRSVAGGPGSSRAAPLAARLGATAAGGAELADPEAGCILIAVPDAKIAEVARRLAGRRRSGVALHVSGALGASVLAPLVAAGCRAGAFHPLRAFPAVEEDVRAAAGTFYALDGDAEARSMGRRLAKAFDGESAVVDEELRPLYHWAASVAAGSLVALLATAHDVARRLNLPDSARRGYDRLAAGALGAALASGDPAAAMTGPAARGDLETLHRHLEALAARRPDLLSLAVELARTVVARAAENAPLDPAQLAVAEWLARPDLLDRAKDRVLASPRPKSA